MLRENTVRCDRKGPKAIRCNERAILVLPKDSWKRLRYPIG